MLPKVIFVIEQKEKDETILIATEDWMDLVPEGGQKVGIYELNATKTIHVTLE